MPNSAPTGLTGASPILKDKFVALAGNYYVVTRD